MSKYIIYQNTTKGVNYVSEKYGSPNTTDINKAFKYDSVEEADAQKKICNKVFMKYGKPLCMIGELRYKNMYGCLIKEKNKSNVMKFIRENTEYKKVITNGVDGLIINCINHDANNKMITLYFVDKVEKRENIEGIEAQNIKNIEEYGIIGCKTDDDILKVFVDKYNGIRVKVDMEK